MLDVLIAQDGIERSDGLIVTALRAIRDFVAADRFATPAQVEAADRERAPRRA